MGNMGRIVYGVTASVAISVASFSFAWGDGENERYYNVMGRKLILKKEELFVGIDGKVKVDGKYKDDIEVWRVLYPIRTGKGFNGFYGYADFLLKDEEGKEILKGPIIIEYEKAGAAATEKSEKAEAAVTREVELYKGPFSAEDFETAMEIAKDKSLLIVVDLNGFYDKNGKELLKNISKGAVGAGAKPPALGSIVNKGMFKRVESKYATLIPEKTYAGWSGTKFNVLMDLGGDLGIEPGGIDKAQSFISYEGGFCRAGVEQGIKVAKRKKQAVAKPSEGKLPPSREPTTEGFFALSEEVKPKTAGPPGISQVKRAVKSLDETRLAGKGRPRPPKSVSFFVVSEVRDKGVRVEAGVPGFEKAEFEASVKEKGATRDLITCLKVEDGDPFYAPGYIVSETRLFEGEIVSVVNMEYDSRVYFDTNMIEEYIENLIKWSEPESGKVNTARNRDTSEDDGQGAESAAKKTTIRFKIIRGEDDNRDGVKRESDPGDIKETCSERRYLNKKERSEVKAQAYVTIPRQLKKGERVKLEILEDGEIPVLTIDGKIKEVKGSAFKDERDLSVQALFEHEMDAKNVRVKADYSDYQPLSIGRCRWFGHLDLVNSEASGEEYVKGDGEFFVLGMGGSRQRLGFGLGASANGSYFPRDPEEFRHAGGGVVSEINCYVGNIAEQKYLWRFSLAPEGDYEWNSKLNLAASGAAPERIGKWLWRFQLPLTASYSFDGVRFEGKFAPSYLNDVAREMFGVKTHVPFYVAFTASLDPKFVHGLPRGLDSQSAVAVNLTYELGRSPPKFEELGNKFSLGIEYAPVTK